MVISNICFQKFNKIFIVDFCSNNKVQSIRCCLRHVDFGLLAGNNILFAVLIYMILPYLLLHNYYIFVDPWHSNRSPLLLNFSFKYERFNSFVNDDKFGYSLGKASLKLRSNYREEK